MHSRHEECPKCKQESDGRLATAPMKREVKNITFIIEDCNGNQFRSKGDPAIWINSDGVPVLEISCWDNEYTQEEYDNLPHEDFKLIGVWF
jgi:hypothetical protein